MTVAAYVDGVVSYPDSMIAPAARRYGKKWSHLTADTPEELHAFAILIGLKRQWCSDVVQPTARRLHYDIRPPARVRAVECGAVEIRGWLKGDDGVARPVLRKPPV